MKSFIEYKEDIYKCSKCGLCQSVCPVYKITKNECILSRGKFTILNGIVKNDLKLNKNVIKNLDICLNCNTCKNYCPSDIDAKNIFASVKNEFNSKNNRFSDFLYSSYFFDLKMNFICFLTNIYRFLKIDVIVEKLTPILLKTGTLGKRIVLLNSTLKINTKRKKSSNQFKHTGKVIFFEGCFNKYINPSSKNATLNLIEEMGYEIVKTDLKCCGVSNYYSGHFHEFKKQAESIINTIPEDIDAIICDCSTCLSVLKSYKDFFPNAEHINKKTISIVEFLERNDYKKKFKKKFKLTYHKPCHEDFENEKLFKNIENIEYTPLDNNSCCGFAGEFAVKYQNLSRTISQQKAEAILKTESDIIITTCPSCVMGLKQGLTEIDHLKTVLNISEFLNID